MEQFPKEAGSTPASCTPPQDPGPCPLQTQPGCLSLLRDMVWPPPPRTGAQKARQFTLVSWDVSLRSPEQPRTKQSFPEATRLRGSPGHTYGPRGGAQRGSPLPTEAQVTARIDQADVRETGLQMMIPGPGRPNPSKTPPAPRVP